MTEREMGSKKAIQQSVHVVVVDILNPPARVCHGEPEQVRSDMSRAGTQ